MFRKQVDVTPQNRAMTNKVQLAAPSTIADDLQGLMSFTGAAAGVATNYLNQKIETDAIKQQMRVSQGQLPSEDATAGGYRAAAALGLSMESEKREARLSEFAKSNPSDEAWEAELLKETENSRNYLASKYPAMQEDPELQKLVAMDAIDSIPALTSQREVARLKVEHSTRIADFGEYAILAARNAGDAFDEQLKFVAQELKLDPTTVQNTLVDTAISSGDINLLERVSGMKMGNSELTLGESDARINTAFAQAKSKSARQNAAVMAQEQLEMESQLANGQINPSQFVKMVQLKNDTTGGAFMSQAQVASTMSKIAADAGQKNYISTTATAISTGAVNTTTMKKEDKQAAAGEVFNLALEDATEALPDNLKGTVKGQTLARSQAIAKATTDLGRSGIVSESIKQNVTSVLAINPDSVISEEGGIEKLNSSTQQALNDYIAIPSHIRHQYAKGTEAQMLNEYARLVESGGMEPVQALRMAQSNTLDKPALSGAIFEASSSVINDTLKPWFGINVSESNENYWQGEVQTFLKAFPDPNSDSAQKAAKRYIEDNTTNLGGGMFVKGNSDMLINAMGLHNNSVDSVKEGVEIYKTANQAAITQASEIYGFNPKDTIVDINTTTGRVMLLTPDRIPIVASSTNLEGIGKGYIAEKNKALRVRYDEEVQNGKDARFHIPVPLSSRFYK